MGVVDVDVHVSSHLKEELAWAADTVWLQIFVVENFCNFHNCTVITKILFTKFLSQFIIVDTKGAR